MRSADLADSLHNLGVPDAMQIWFVAAGRSICEPWFRIKELHGNAIAATIVVGCRVQRLVEIADKVYNEHQRIGLILQRARCIAQDVELLLDRGCYATGSGIARARYVRARSPKGISIKCQGPVSFR